MFFFSSRRSGSSPLSKLICAVSGLTIIFFLLLYTSCLVLASCLVIQT